MTPGIGDEESEWLDAAAATARLNVKPQTLYAYVSRGLVRSERRPGMRVNRYWRADLERLAARGHRSAGSGPEIVVDSAVTLLDPAGHLYYRGWDVTHAAVEASYEQVAEWLWGTSPSPGDAWPVSPVALRVARAAQTALPDHASLPDRLRVIVAAMATCDPLRNDRRTASVVARVRTLIATLVEALPLAGTTDGRARGPSIAARLWTRVSPLPPTPSRVRALDRALVLLADHDLAASTFAVRIAASTWADPYLLVLTGLAAAGGPLHAGASEQVRVLLREITDGRSAEDVIGARLRDAQRVPGFGHAVYQGADPRAVALFEIVQRSHPPRALARAAVQVLDIIARDGGPQPNIDMALGLLAEASAMVPGGGEAVFVIARCAGWIAHGIEEYPHRLRYRIRSAYTGPPPSSPAS